LFNRTNPLHEKLNIKSWFTKFRIIKSLLVLHHFAFMTLKLSL
jgi:hypothetical protein